MIISLQYLRAIAALMVIAFHICLKLHLSEDHLVWTEIGAAGVDIFFIISGFMMYLTTNKNKMSVFDFYKKRLIRIAPLYFFFTTLTILIILFLPSLPETTKLELNHVLASYMFVAWPHPNMPTLMWPLLIPGWTLNYEVFFYLIVGVTLIFSQNRMIFLTSMILTLVLSGTLFEFEGQAKFYTSPLMLEFLLGYWLSFAYCREYIKATLSALAILVIALALFMTISPIISPAPWTRLVHWGIPAFLLVAAVALLDRAKPPWLSPLGLLIGNASYAIYLVQFLSIPTFTMIWRLMKLPLESAWAQGAFFISSITAVSIAGIIVYKFVELPLNDFIKRYL